MTTPTGTRNRRSRLLAAVALTATAALTVPVTAAPAAGAGQRLEASLHGGSAGDPDGTGHATLTLYKKAGKVCATITWAHIGTPTAAHVHRRSDGGVVLGLTSSVTGGPKCRTGVKHKLIERLAEHPRRYYVNVHNDAFPAGAIRGRLHR